MIFIFVWLTLLNMTISRPTYVAANDTVFFLWLSNIPLYICTTSSLFIPLFLSIVNNAEVNIGDRVSFCIVVFSGYMPLSGIAGSYASSIFSFSEESPDYSPEWLHQFTRVGGFPFLHTFPSTCYFLSF